MARIERKNLKLSEEKRSRRRSPKCKVRVVRSEEKSEEVRSESRSESECKVNLARAAERSSGHLSSAVKSPCAPITGTQRVEGSR